MSRLVCLIGYKKATNHKGGANLRAQMCIGKYPRPYRTRLMVPSPTFLQKQFVIAACPGEPVCKT